MYACIVNLNNMYFVDTYRLFISVYLNILLSEILLANHFIAIMIKTNSSNLCSLNHNTNRSHQCVL